MRIKNVLVTVGCTGVAFGALTFPASADAAPGGSIPVRSSVQTVLPQDCVNGGGRPDYYSSPPLCLGGSHNGETVTQP